MEHRSLENSHIAQQYSILRKESPSASTSVDMTSSLQRNQLLVDRGGGNLTTASQRKIMMGDRLMVMNENGGLDDPQGINQSIIPEHIHIKRPMNAFMCWAQIARRRLADEKPELRNTELSKILGQMWKELNKDQKTPFIKKAEHLRLQHKTQYPNYKYKPKRKRHSKYAIVPSPELLSPVTTDNVKLSHPSYLCNIVKEENRSVFTVNNDNYQAKLEYDAVQGRHPRLQYHDYNRQSPNYSIGDLASYSRDMGYYQILQQPSSSTPPATHSLNRVTHTSTTVSNSSPDDTRSPTAFTQLRSTPVNISHVQRSSAVSRTAQLHSNLSNERQSVARDGTSTNISREDGGLGKQNSKRFLGNSKSEGSEVQTTRMGNKMLKMCNIVENAQVPESAKIKSVTLPIASYINYCSGRDQTIL